MEIIISHKSALEYWRLHRSEKIADSAGKNRKSLPVNPPNLVAMRDRIPSGLLYPINIMVGVQNAKRKSKNVKSHVYTGSTPNGCFVSIGDELAVSSPPFCFFQMAGELPLVKLIELGLELCGTYSLPVMGGKVNGQGNKHGSGQGNMHGSGQGNKHGNGQVNKHGSGQGNKQGNEQSNGEKIEDKILHGNKEIIIDHSLYDRWEENADQALYSHDEEIADKTLYGLPQLTNTKEIKAFTARMEGVHGKKKACRALRYISDGSASPMETILYMLLTLPHTLGGYGLPAPELNKRIEPGKKTKDRFGKAYYVCDFLWPKAGLALEYDSDYYHTGADRIADDSMKRLDLARRRITVITVTSRQVRNENEFESLARLIARKLHKQLRYKATQFMEAKHELRNLLL